MRRLFKPLVIVALLTGLWMQFVRANPGGVSDAKYEQFKQLRSPKVLYSCIRKPMAAALLQQTRECAETGRAGCSEKAYESGEEEVATTIDFLASQGTSTYDEVLRNASRQCAKDVGKMGNGKFTVLEAEKD